VTKRRGKAESVPRRQTFIVFQAGFLSVSSSSSSSSQQRGRERERERESFFVGVFRYNEVFGIKKIRAREKEERESSCTQ
jgi:hypothetical protein